MAAAAVHRTQSQAFMRWHEHAFSSTGRLWLGSAGLCPALLAALASGAPALLRAGRHIAVPVGIFIPSAVRPCQSGLSIFLHRRANRYDLLEILCFSYLWRTCIRRRRISHGKIVHCRATIGFRTVGAAKSPPGNRATADPGRALKLQPDSRRAYLTIWMLVFDGPKASTNS